MMTLHPKVIDLTLGRVERLLAALGNPERSIPPVIHVAGTNGKGSTQAYTSPHLARFHERIRLAGELISEDLLTRLLDECVTANGGEEITFFEITTCAAFLAFSRVPADWTLLEVGLGGRLDATNMIDRPRLTIITPVSLDHQAFLGDTVGAIAGEKAGIIKRGVPVIVGPQTDEGLQVIEAQAARLGAPVLAHGQHWHVSEDRGRLVYQDENGLLDLPLPNLPGPHQIQNAGAALAALRFLGRDEAACEAAVTRAEWPARMQRLRHGPLVELAPKVELWLDGGHNPAGAEAVAATLARFPARETHVICGMLNTKDVRGYMTPLASHVRRHG
jgi:dihydrofolate synthase / folylpolyglutamate synthase